MITNFAGQPLGVFARGSPFSTDTVIPVTGDVNGKALCPVECFMHRYDPRGREQLSSYYLFTAEKTYLPGSTHRRIQFISNSTMYNEGIRFQLRVRRF